MALIKIAEPNKKVKYYAGIDQQTEELKFTEKASEAKHISSGFWLDSEFDWVMFHFKDKYPELQYASKALT